MTHSRLQGAAGDLLEVDPDAYPLVSIGWALEWLGPDGSASGKRKWLATSREFGLAVGLHL